MTKLIRILTILPINGRNKFIVNYYALNNDRIKNAYAINMHNDSMQYKILQIYFVIISLSIPTYLSFRLIIYSSAIKKNP